MNIPLRKDYVILEMNDRTIHSLRFSGTIATSEVIAFFKLFFFC